MHLSSIQVLLLAVVAITSTPRSALGQVAPKTCTDADLNKQFCSSCSQTSKCETTGNAPVPKTKCASGQACTVLLGKYAVCKPVAETPCACGVKPAKCDPYDPNNIFICLNGGITTSKDCSTDVPDGTCIDGECGTEPPEATTISVDELCPDGEAGFIAVTPVCTAAAFCEDGKSLGITAPCGAMQYYDVDKLECLPAPPLPCPVTSGSGAFPDKGNCSKWYICYAGTVLAEETCEGATPKFDTVKLECVASGTCSKNDGCNFDLITTLISSSPTTTSSSTKTITTPPTTTSTTTSTRTITTPPPTTSTTTSTRTITTPSTTTSTSSSSSSTTSTSSSIIRPATCSAANVGIRYPVAGNCKKYQSCRLVSTNVYAYVEASCLGSLVFNPKTGYCDTLTNVPGCAAPI